MSVPLASSPLYQVTSPIEAQYRLVDYKEWFIHQHMTEVMTRYDVDNTIGHPRSLMYKNWRCDPHISVWTCLSTKPYNMNGARKPTQQQLRYDAESAYERADKDKVKQLYEMWNHPCQDPYYCKMHGFGSD